MLVVDNLGKTVIVFVCARNEIDDHSSFLQVRHQVLEVSFFSDQNEDCVFGRPEMAESSSLWRSDTNSVCTEPGAAGLKLGLRCSDYVPEIRSSMLSKHLSQTKASSVSGHPGGLEVYLL